MNFLVAVAQSPHQWDVLSTWGADLVNCCTFLHPLGELGGGCSNWTLPTLQVHYVQLWVWNCLPLLEKLYPLPSPLLCDLNTVARPCYLSLRSQMACEQIFKPADHLREGTSPCKLKGQAPHTCTPTMSVLWDSLFIIVLEAASFRILHVIPSCRAMRTGLEVLDHST